MPVGGMVRVPERAYRGAMAVKGISRGALTATLVVAAVLLAVGAAEAVGLVTRETHTRTRTVPAAKTVELVVGSSDVAITGTARRDMRLTTVEHRSVWAQPDVRISYRDGRFGLDDGCAAVPLVLTQCAVDYRLEVPRGTRVRVVATSGDVHLEVPDGAYAVDTRASSGDEDVGVRGHPRDGGSLASLG
jgi:hypothetical protein